MNKSKKIKLISLIILVAIIMILPLKLLSARINSSKENFKIGEHIYVQLGEVKEKNLVCIGGDIYISGEVKGSALSIGGNVYVNGKVDKNVTTLFGEIVKGANGEVNGKEREMFKSPKITEKFKSTNINRKFNTNYEFISSFIFLSICSAIVYFFMSININFMMNYLVKENIFRGVIYGYLAILALIAIISTLILSFLGVVLIPFITLMFFLFFIIGFTTIATFLGEEFYKRFGIGHSPYIRIVIGVAILYLIRSIAILNIGNILWKLIIIPLSMGIIFIKRFMVFR